MEIHKKIIFDKNQRPFAVQIPIEEFKLLDKIIENQSKLTGEIKDEEILSVAETKEYYQYREGGALKMNHEEIENEALKLDPSLRAKLAEKLLHSLESLTDAENELLWAQEALRRHEELETGNATARPGADVLRDARARLL